MKLIKLFEEFVNEGVNGTFGEGAKFSWIYDKPFKTLTIQEPGYKSGRSFREIEIKQVSDIDVKKLVDQLSSEDELSWGMIKTIIKNGYNDVEIISERGIKESFLDEYQPEDWKGEDDVTESVQTCTQIVKSFAALTAKRGGNGVNIELAANLADHLDAYAASRSNSGPGEDGYYSTETMNAFSNLIKSMSNDEIAANKK